MASQAALWLRTCRIVAVVSPDAEKVIGAKAMQAVLARIAVPRVPLHAAIGMINVAASSNRLVKRITVCLELALLRLHPPRAMAAPLHDKLCDRTNRRDDAQQQAQP